MSLNKNPRRWFYTVIPIPLDKDGNGPCSVEEAVDMVYEVWDIFCNDYGTYKNLSEAIEQAIKLNTGHKTLDHKYCEEFWKGQEDNELV